MMESGGASPAQRSVCELTESVDPMILHQPPARWRHRLPQLHPRLTTRIYRI